MENTPQRIEGQGMYPLEPDQTTTADDKVPLTVTQYMDGDSSGHEISVEKRQTQRAKHKRRSGRTGSQTTEREAWAPRHLSKRSECSTAVQHSTGRSPQQGQEERGAIGGVGLMVKVHHSTQKGMAVNALEWCHQKLRESSRRSYKYIC